MKNAVRIGLALGVIFLAAGYANAANVSVLFVEGTSALEQDRALVQAGARKVRRIAAIRAVEAVVPGNAGRQALAANPSVSSVEDVIAMHAINTDAPGASGHAGSSGTTGQGDIIPTGVDRVDADQSTFTGTGVTVAIVDTGVDFLHPDLAGNLLPGGFNTVNSEGAQDDHGHGTHVAGTVAAALNGTGVVGVAPDASLLAVKVLDSNGSGTDVTVADGIVWAADNGANVINMSLGGGSTSTLQAAVVHADGKGVVIVCAAGNSGKPRGKRFTSTVGYPAAYAECIAVSAWTDTDGTSADVDGSGADESIANFSSRGPEVEIAGPGVNILSDKLGGGTTTMSGTSMATPHVVGVAALLIEEAGTGWNAASIRQAIGDTAEALAAKSTDVGAGLAHAPDSGGTPPPPPPTPTVTALTVGVTANGSVFKNRDKVLIDVTVTDQNQKPVAGAPVSTTVVTANDATLGASGLTDSGGVARFSYRVNARRHGKGTYTVSATASVGSLSNSGGTEFEVQ